MQALWFDIWARDMTGGAFKSVQEGAEKIGRQFQQAGALWSGYVTAPIVAAGALTLNAAGDFEEAMNSVNAAAGGLDAAGFDAMRDAAIRLGAETAFSASEGAEALEMLIKNGLNAEQVLDGAADATVALASATGANLAPAADAITDVMAQFSREASGLGDVADQISGTLVASKMGFDDYRQAIGQAGGVAGKVGVDFEDMNAVLAGTSSAFSSGSDAGTSFKTFLQRLTPASKPAAQAMKQLGLQFFDAEGNMKSMAEVAEELRTGIEGLSDEARISSLQDIFGSDAIRTAMMMGEQGAEGINKLKAAIGDVSSVDQAEARMKGYNGALRELSGAFESLQIAIADSGLLEWATEAVKAATGFVRSLIETSPEILKWGTIVAGLAAVVGPALIGFGLMASGAAALMGVLAGVGGVIGTVLLSPLALVAGAVAAAALAFGVGFDDIAGVVTNLGPLLDGAWAGVSAAMAGLGEAVAASGVVESLSGLGTTIMGALSGVGAAVASAVSPIADTVMTALGSLVDGFAGAFDLAPMLDAASGAFAAFGAALSGLGAVIMAGVEVWGAFYAAVNAVVLGLTGSGLTEWITAAQPLLSALGTAFGVVAGQLLALPFELLKLGFEGLAAPSASSGWPAASWSKDCGWWRRGRRRCARPRESGHGGGGGDGPAGHRRDRVADDQAFGGVGFGVGQGRLDQGQVLRAL
ncbi:phage tail tape measure protein [Methylobrevis pamukkalensis]|uniref:Phage-related minor tail protein n=1 Tax=Methylobrevis pamukkalensis TaxID=1439726 RepID=A0A1E3GZT2_9HYPH|nr:phage tail tape measure protein [Methylobrevis pamukkalensis]ODN69554.1 Phage-related minor tail protein [Methylobrevis pamukkalensis]